MRSLILGALSVLLILIYMIGDTANLAFYANTHSIVLVLGGTIAVLMFSTPWNTMKSLFMDVLNLLKKESNLADFSDELVQLSTQGELAQGSRDPLINRAADLWNKGVSPALFLLLLNQEKIDIDQKSMDSIQSLRNLSKYPPALGMVGTVMGLITLFSNLTPESKASLGPSLAVALTATFFGLIVTNMLITPLADRLQIRQIRRRRQLVNTYQILCLIHSGEAPVIIQEELNSRSGRLGDHAA